MPKTKPSQRKVKTRAAVVRYIEARWGEEKPLIPDQHHGGEHSHRYGLCNLRDLLDYLYGGPPKNKSEELTFK